MSARAGGAQRRLWSVTTANAWRQSVRTRLCHWTHGSTSEVGAAAPAGATALQLEMDTSFGGDGVWFQAAMSGAGPEPAAVVSATAVPNSWSAAHRS